MMPRSCAIIIEPRTAFRYLSVEVTDHSQHYREVRASSLREACETARRGLRHTYAGVEATIIVLSDEHCGAFSLHPVLLYDGPTPVYALSPATAALMGHRGIPTRFIHLDFSGNGTFALVDALDRSASPQYMRSGASLAEMLDVHDTPPNEQSDLLANIAADIASRHPDMARDCRIAEALSRVRDQLDAALRTAFRLGFTSVVCSSRIFRRNQCWESTFFAPMHSTLFVARESKYVGALRSLETAATGPGVWIAATGHTRTLSMATTQETSYRIIHPQRAVFDPAEAALGDLMGSRECAFVVDREVMRIYGSRLVDYARLHLKCATVIDVDAREHNKSLREVERICGVLERLAFPRNAVLVGVGGGVTLDTGGLAASLYRRGISYVRIPTTLVGLVDVAVGIKHGVNFQGQKNLLGTFYPPLACINDSQFLRTLNQRDLACGIAEIIKVALMCDPVLFELLELHVKGLMLSGFSMPGAIAEEVLIRAEMSMMRELQSNLFEHDYRRLMDFGHTFSQKLEIASDHRLAHGEAVALDMLLTTAVAVERGICHTSVLQRLKDLYQVVGLPDWDELLTPQLVLDGVKSSVAHRGGSLNLPLPTGIGLACFAQALDVEDVDAAFALVGRHALATVNA